MLFIDNKYTILYYKIIERARQKNHIKKKYDGYQTHHIVPRCFGGTDDSNNLIVLSYKEHRICHRLLINMTKTDAKYRMMYAYKLFNKHYDTSWVPVFREYKSESYELMVKTRKSRGSYKTGKDNNFSDPAIIKLVRQRMLDNNPMAQPGQKLRMSFRNNNPLCRPIEVNNICFPSISKAAEYFHISPHLFKKNYTYCFCVV